VAFIGLEGVNVVSHKFLLSLSLSFYSSIFTQSLLSSFFAPFLAAQESNFSSHFLKPLVVQGNTWYMRRHVSGTHHAFSQNKMLTETWDMNQYRFSFPVPPFAEGF
jgi:hypothetical protein